MDLKQPYIVIPNLIEQPTWGGQYIANLKNIRHPQIRQLNLGQSYELYQNTKLSIKHSTLNNPSFELGQPDNPEKTKLFAQNDNPITIKSDVLIKLTQAQGNSYQIHVKQKTGQWLSKPESWYFLEPGIVTIGVKPNINWVKYQKTCQAIYQLSQHLYEQIKSNELSVPDAKKLLHEFIAKNNPEQFVNRLTTKKGDAIDLSAGAIHHSWEEDKKQYPLGNIVYEVQKNVYDPECTIRCFDKGKIKSDGSIRNIQIDDYFRYIDRSTEANRPQNHFIPPTDTQIFKTPYYSLEKINLKGKLDNGTDNTFHHLFVLSGNVNLFAHKQQWTITPGFSIFIPAGINHYALTATNATVLKTYV